MNSTSIDNLCSQCGIKLYVADVPPLRELRCAACGAFNAPGLSKGKSSKQRTASWSLGFAALCIITAVLSIALLFGKRMAVVSFILSAFSMLAGIVALILAVRSMLRMRYLRTSKSTKAAVALASLGTGCFGLPLGGFMVMITSVAAIAILTTSNVEGPDKTKQLAERLFHLDIPEDCDLKPCDGSTSPFLLSDINYRDEQKNEDANVWLRVERYPSTFTMNKGQFLGILESRAQRYLGRTGLTKDKKSKLKWKICGNLETVYRVDWSKRFDNVNESGAPDKDQIEPGPTVKQYKNYYSLFDNDRYTFGITLVYHPDKSSLDEAQIKALFESFQRIE